eukprot:scaffold210390_cov34-Tisochrysis_lutea.AAC.4
MEQKHRGRRTAHFHVCSRPVAMCSLASGRPHCSLLTIHGSCEGLSEPCRECCRESYLTH